MKNKIQDVARFLITTWFSISFALPVFAHQKRPLSAGSGYDFGPVRAYIQKMLTDKQLPSVSVAVAKNAKVLEKNPLVGPTEKR